MAFDFQAFLKQPTTIHGLGAIAAAVVGAATQYFAHEASLSAAIAVAVHGVVNVVMKDNTSGQQSVEKLFADTAEAIMEKKVAAMIPALAADALATMKDIQTPAPGA